MGKVLVHGTGMGQRRAALVKGCGETFSEEFISETRFKEWDIISCVKIWKKSILGRIASCHVMDYGLCLIYTWRQNWGLYGRLLNTISKHRDGDIEKYQLLPDIRNYLGRWMDDLYENVTPNNWSTWGDNSIGKISKIWLIYIIYYIFIQLLW